MLIELTIHNTMHLRWGAPPGSSFPSPEDPTQGETIPLEWDDSQYDFLVETYSSHVNPIFWKLHGWIDDRVEEWKGANGVFGNDFWKGTWVGKLPGHEPPMPSHSVHLMLEQPQLALQHLTDAEEAVGVVRKSRVLLYRSPSFRSTTPPPLLGRATAIQNAHGIRPMSHRSSANRTGGQASEL